METLSNKLDEFKGSKDYANLWKLGDKLFQESSNLKRRVKKVEEKNIKHVTQFDGVEEELSHVSFSYEKLRKMVKAINMK